MMVDLDTVTVTIHDVDSPRPISLDRRRAIEPLLRIEALGNLAALHIILVGLKVLDRPLGESRVPAKLRQKTALGAEHLRAMVSPIGDPNIPGGINGHARGAMELAIACTRLAEFHQK